MLNIFASYIDKEYIETYIATNWKTKDEHTKKRRGDLLVMFMLGMYLS